MNKKLITQLIIGTIFVSILGCLSHFFYDWSNRSLLVAFFCPVSESTWEHMKLLFFPMLLYTLYLSKRYPDYSNMLSALLAGNLLGTLLIPVLFYSYSGILGRHITAVDIAIFFICTLFSFYKVYCILFNKNAWKKQEAQSKRFTPHSTLSNFIRNICCSCQTFFCHRNFLIAATILLCSLFWIFTFCPPDIPLFISPE